MEACYHILNVTATSCCLQEHDEQPGLLFTYVNADDFCRRAEADKRVTTSALGSSASMRSTFARRARHCREVSLRASRLSPVHRAGCQALRCLQVLLRQHMYIMADCTAREDPREGGRHDEHVLVHMEAWPDGSLSMHPGISTNNEAYRLEDASGQALCTHKMTGGSQLFTHDGFQEMRFGSQDECCTSQL